MKNKKYYTVKELSYIFRLGEQMIRRKIVNGIIPARNIGTKKHPVYRVPSEFLKNEEYYKVKELSEVLRISKPTVIARIKDKTIPALNLGNIYPTYRVPKNYADNTNKTIERK